MNTTEEHLSRAMAIAEAAAQDMAAEGIPPQARAIGLASEMNRQADIAMPTPMTRHIFKISLVSGGSP